MVKFTRLNGGEFWLNPDRVLVMEKTPETVLSLEDGKKLTVKETPDEVVAKVLQWQRQRSLPPGVDPSNR